MKKALIIVAMVMLAFVLVVPSAYAEGDWTGNLNFILGQKTMDGDWDPVDEQGLFGINIDFGKRSWPVHMAIDLTGTSTTGTDPFWGDIEGSTGEFNLGARKIWEIDSFKPFIGGGLSFMSAEVKFKDVGFSCDGTTTGLWFGGGAYWTLGERFNLGFDLKQSSGKIASEDITCTGGWMMTDDLEVGGTQMGLLLGIHW